MIAQRHERGAACERGHGIARIEGEAGTEEAADGSRTDDADLHGRAFAP